MAVENYKNFWEQRAVTEQQAREAVDGSVDEETLQVTGAWTAKTVAAALLLQKSDRVLELGCGVGRIGRELAPLCGQWYGVDIAGNMIAVAQKRTAHLDNVHLHTLSRTSLSMFADSSFDKAYSVAVFIHLDKEDMFLYLQEVARVLRPGGLLYFDTWNLTHEIGWQRWMMEVEHWAGADQIQRKDVARNQFCVPEEARFYTQRAGLTELFCLTDSPWLQMIAAKPGANVVIDDLRERVRAQLPQVSYSPLWNHLFGALLEVFTGKKKPGDFWRELQSLESAPEARPYRQYLLALWKTRQHEWGAVPQGSP
jgi:SAM-dependent methyltransferase